MKKTYTTPLSELEVVHVEKGGNMGGSTDESRLPAIYEIDYVRVFKKD